MTATVEDVATHNATLARLFEIPEGILASEQPFVIQHFALSRIPLFEDYANECESDLAAPDSEHQEIVSHARAALNDLRSSLTEADQKHGELRRKRGEALVSGADTRELDKELRQVQLDEERLQDQLPVREAQLAQLEREAAPVHLEFVRGRRNAYAEIIKAFKDEAHTVQRRFGILMAIIDAGERRLDQYDTALLISQQRAAAICNPKES